LKTLLQLQDLDLKIEARKRREQEIPKQKDKFQIHRERLHEELRASEEKLKSLQVEQRELESEIDQKQAQIDKYNTQLLAVKKNEEYTALLHEIEGIKKQISQKEERILIIMEEIDNAKAHLDEDRKRIQEELRDIENECARIDEELKEATRERKELEAQRGPILENIEKSLLARYNRIRKSLKTGPAVVPLRGETCTGCNMMITAQIFNEILAGDKMHSCRNCGRLLYHPDNFGASSGEAEAETDLEHS
jgi:uncharacterized protein